MWLPPLSVLYHILGYWTFGQTKQAIRRTWLLRIELHPCTYQYWIIRKNPCTAFHCYCWLLVHRVTIRDRLSNCFILSGGKTTLAATQATAAHFHHVHLTTPHLLPLPWRYIASHIHANESQSYSARDMLPLVRRYFSSSRSNNTNYHKVLR